MKEQLVSALKQCGIYSLQLDEGTDIADNTNLSINAFNEIMIYFCININFSVTKTKYFLW